MPLKNEKLDRKADEALEALAAMSLAGLSAYYFNGDYFWYVFWVVVGRNFLKFIIAVAKDSE